MCDDVQCHPCCVQPYALGVVAYMPVAAGAFIGLDPFTVALGEELGVHLLGGLFCCCVGGVRCFAWGAADDTVGEGVEAGFFAVP